MYNIKFDFKDLENFKDRAEELDEKYQNILKKSVVKLGEFAVGIAKEKTAVGKYDSYIIDGKVIRNGKVGGNLRNSWNRSSISGSDGNYSVDIFNPVEYAQFYEYGHRQKPGRFVPVLGKRLKAQFVEGRFPLKKAMNEIEDIIGEYISNALNEVK